MVNALRTDYRTAPISEQDRTMLDYVGEADERPTKCGPEDHDDLARRCFDDRAFLADHADRVLV